MRGGRYADPREPPRIVRRLATALFLAASLVANAGAGDDRPLPAFTHTAAQDWINSAPLTVGSLRGHVVLLDVWTFECWNCYRSFPWLKKLEARFAPRGLKVIGIHTPEFPRERVRANVQAGVRKFALSHPVMMDNDLSYWKALKNRYWPTFYIVDKKGRIRGVFVGETHEGDANATGMESLIAQLLQE